MSFPYEKECWLRKATQDIISWGTKPAGMKHAGFVPQLIGNLFSHMSKSFKSIELSEAIQAFVRLQTILNTSKYPIL